MMEGAALQKQGRPKLELAIFCTRPKAKTHALFLDCALS
jgi:hypothetical protein